MPFFIFLLLLSPFSFSTELTLSQRRAVLSKETGIDLQNCTMQAECGDLASFNCKAEVDGPFYYINTKLKKLEQCCGGCCLKAQRFGTHCGECPPKKWSCKNTHACDKAIQNNSVKFCDDEKFPESAKNPKDSCIHCYAIAKKNSTLCDSITDSAIKNDCLIYATKETSHLTPAFCEKMNMTASSGKDLYLSCLSEARKGQEKVDLSICDKMKSVKGENFQYDIRITSCYEEWIKQTGDHKICDDLYKKSSHAWSSCSATRKKKN